MILYIFFIIFTWIMVIVSLKILKDFALTSIFGLLLTFLGLYGFSSGFAIDTLIFVFSIAHIFIGLYFVTRSSIELITKDIKWRKPEWEVFKEWLRQKNKKERNNLKKNLK